MMPIYLRLSELKIGTPVVVHQAVLGTQQQVVGLVVSWDGFAGFVEVLCPDGKTRMFNDAYLQGVK